MEHRDQLLLTVASIIGLGIGGQWLSWRLRVPAHSGTAYHRMPRRFSLGFHQSRRDLR